MKILITGGAGFIGSHVAEEFLLNSHKVVIFDNLSTGSMENINFLKKNSSKSNFEFIKGDVSVSKDMDRIPKDCDVIIHLAAIVSVPKSIENPEESNTVTLGGTINIFEFAKKNNIKKIIQASSAAVYGDVKKFPVKEEYAGNFISPYAISKFTSELYATYYEKIFDIKTVSLRFFNVYGERQAHDSPYSGVIAKFVNALTNQKEINIFGDGKNTRDFIYVKDIANIIYKISQDQNFKTDVYNLGTGKAITLLEMIKILEKIFNLKANVKYLDARQGDIRKSVASISKIKKHYKFKPKYTLEQGLRSMLKK